MAINWKKVGTGVVVASIGAAAFGAVHFMFLAPQVPAGDIMGVTYSALLPFLIGAAGIALSMHPKVKGTMQQVVQAGSAAVIGFGVAQYANWIVPTPQLRARALTAPRNLAIQRPASIVRPTAPTTKLI